jgi:hypothetical protein
MLKTRGSQSPFKGSATTGGTAEHLGNENVQQIQCIIQCGRFQIAGERHQCRKSAGFRQPANDTDFGSIGESGQRMQPTGGNAVSHGNIDSQAADFLHRSNALTNSDYFSRTAPFVVGRAGAGARHPVPPGDLPVWIASREMPLL